MGFSCHSVRTLRVGTKVVGGTVFQAKLWSAAQHKSVESNSIRIAHLIYKSGRYHSSSYEVRPRPAALHKVWEVQKIKSNCTFLPVQVISLGGMVYQDKLCTLLPVEVISFGGMVYQDKLCTLLSVEVISFGGTI